MKKTGRPNTLAPKAQVKRPAAKSSAKLWILAALCLVAGSGTWAFCEFVLWNKLPPELVGKWVITLGPQEGATFDFYRSGTMIGRINLDGRLGIVRATVHVDDKKIYSTTKHPETGQETTTVQIIRTLTAEELVVEDQKGNLTYMKRAD